MQPDGPGASPESPAGAGPDGERAAVLALVAPHWEAARILAGVLAPAGAAEDVLRATARAAWRHRDQLDPSPEGQPPGSGVRTWLLAVVADEARGHKRRAGTGPGAPSGDPALRAALAALPPDQGLALALHAYLGLEPEVAAAVLGRDAVGARAAVEQGRQRLARDLGPPEAPAPAGPIVEQRLRADADRARTDAPLAALDALLDAAAARRPRRSRRLWLAVAAVVAVGIAVPVIALTTRSPASTPPVATRIVQEHNAGFTGAVRDPDDPKRLYVLVTERAGDSPCLLQNPTATVTAQSATSVTIKVSGQREVPATAVPGKRLTYACRATVYVQVTAELAAPLGERAVIDAATGRAQPVLDPSTVPEPAYVPDGYQPQPVTWQPATRPPGTDRGTGAPSPEPTPSPNPALGAPATWAALRGYRDGPAELDVRVLDPSRLVGANPVGSATVAGHAATVTQSGGTRCVSWTQSAARAVQVCSTLNATTGSGASQRVGRPDVAPLDREQLLRVARSLS